MEEFAEEFRHTVEDAATRMRAISESDSERPREDGKWSAKQILGHLIDSAANNHIRFVKAQLTDHLEFPGYEQEDWVRLQRYQTQPWSQLIEHWRLYNLHLAHVIAAIPETTLKQARTRHNLDQIAWQTVPRTEPVTLDYFIRDYLGHMKNHLRQILG